MNTVQAKGIKNNFSINDKNKQTGYRFIGQKDLKLFFLLLL